MSEDDQRLLATLKKWRSAKAREQKYKLYCVLNNAALEVLTLRKPMTKEDMLVCKWVRAPHDVSCLQAYRESTYAAVALCTIAFMHRLHTAWDHASSLVCVWPRVCMRS